MWAGDPEPLGVTPDARGANVAVHAPGAERVRLCVLHDDGSETRLELPGRTGGVHHGYVPGLTAGTRYGLRADGPWDPARGARFNPAKLLLDPYARAVTGRLVDHPAVLGHHGDDLVRDDADSAPYVPHGVVMPAAEPVPDTRPRVPWSDTVVYELHVKGYTVAHPDVPAPLRGTYAGLAHPAVVEHMLGLGVTTVELLPVHQFVDEVGLARRGLRNYWGYNTLAFFAPHAAYAASGSQGAQVEEFAAMVAALHDAGLEVLLDVVYNHTAEGDERGPTLSFRGLDNTGYYRLRDSGRRYADTTGCGNTVDLTCPAALRLVLDSLRHWAALGVDGFRFDLATALARTHDRVDLAGAFMAAVGADPVLRERKLVAEPWDVGPGGYRVGQFPAPWTEWNDRYRDCVRDFWRGATGVGELGWRLTGSADLYAGAHRPAWSSVNFVAAHDGFTARDLVTYARKHNEANGEGNADGSDVNRSVNHGVEGETRQAEINHVRHQHVRNLLTTLVLSAGVPMLLAGDEMGRTQGGSNNAYCQDNAVAWVDWDLAGWQRNLLAFSTRLLRLRAEHPVFRQGRFFAGEPVVPGGPKDLAWLTPAGTELDEAGWHDPATRTLGVYLAGDLPDPGRRGPQGGDDSFLLLLHAGDGHTPFVLPGPPYGRSYRRVLDTVSDRGQPAPWKDPAGATVMLAPRNVVVLQVVDR